MHKLNIVLMITIFLLKHAHLPNIPQDYHPLSYSSHLASALELLEFISGECSSIKRFSKFSAFNVPLTKVASALKGLSVQFTTNSA